MPEVQEDVIQSQEVSIKYITGSELNDILSKYFYTKEEVKELEKKELENLKERQALEEKEQKKENEKTLQEKQMQQQTQQEFQSELIGEIQKINSNATNINGLSYIAMVLACLVGLYILFYKFLKNFI